MERRKRRVAHASKEKCNEMVDDVVTGIIKAMDSKLANSGNQQFCDILNITNRNKSTNNLDISSVIPKQPSMTHLQKKILGSKRHPLMEKVQKNVSYIKHNRSMPKPRAHLAGLGESVQKRKAEMHSIQNYPSPQLKSRKTCSAPSKSKPTKSNRPTDNTFSDESASDVNSKLPESDAESDFESFIQSQKEFPDGDIRKSSKNKKSTKSKKKKDKNRSSCSKRKKSQMIDDILKCMEEKSSDDEILKKKVKISSKVSHTNRLMLPETSDSSVSLSDENDCNIEVSDENDCNVEVSDEINATVLRCSVRLERNPYLDKTVSQFNSPILESSIEDNAYCSGLLDKERRVVDELKDCIDLDSDDDCMVLHEVPKTDAVNIGDIESCDNESDIQILNVVSLKECKEDYEADHKEIASKISSSFCNEDSNEINYEKLKEAVQIVLENSSHHSDLGGNIADSMQTDTVKKETLSMSPDIIETVKKIDFKQILTLANSPAMCDMKEFNTSLCSASFVEESPAFSKLPLNASVNIPESHWRNLEKAVNMNCLPNALSAASELYKRHPENSDFVKPENRTNLADNLLTSSRPSTSSIDSVKNGYDDPCDELDILTAATFENLCQSPSNQALLKLIDLYTRTYREYEVMKCRATAGVHLMQHLAAEKKKEVESILEFIMQHDPCLYKAALEHKRAAVNTSINTNWINDEMASPKETKKCFNCENEATINCGWCKMVYFCSDTCGVHYWENKHYKECTGLKQ